MIFPIKNENEMLSEMMSELQLKTGINDFSPGSIARSLLEVFNRKLHTAYEDFDLYASMRFVSLATGPYLDLLGDLLACKRYTAESDDNYRYRITNQVFTTAAANKTSLRLKCLSINGVKDIIMTKYTRGSGSFTIHVLTDEIDTPESILQEVRKVVNATKAEGVNATVTKPSIAKIEIEFAVVLSGKNSTSTRSISSEVTPRLQEYVDSLSMGSPVNIQKMVSIASLTNYIDRVMLSSFKVNGQHVVLRDEYSLEWDERPFIENVSFKIV